MYPINEAVERFDRHSHIPGVVSLAKKESGHAVYPRVAPGVGSRQYGYIWYAAEVDQALGVAAFWAQGGLVVGTGPRSADVAAENRKFMVKLGNAVAMQGSALGNIGKCGVNALKFHRAQVDYALPEASNAINGEHGGKIDAVCKSKAILLFYFIQAGNISRKGNTEARVFS